MKAKLPYPIGGLLLVAVIIIFIVIKVFPKDPQETAPFACPGGRTVFRYKYPSKALPVITRVYDANFNATTDVLKKISDSASQLALGLDVKNKVIELQDKLNQDNITLPWGCALTFTPAIQTRVTKRCKLRI